MDYEELIKIMDSIAVIEKEKITRKEYVVHNLSFMKLRDVLINCSHILYEDIERNIYIAEIKSGFFKKNAAITAFQLDHNKLKVLIYSKEGLVNQKTTEGVINEIKSQLINYIC